METKSKFRSSSYPAIPLGEAIEDLEKVRKNLGKGSYSRESISHALGYKGLNGASARKVAALAQFGLLERIGNTYKYSILSDRIFFPVEESDKREAIREAALSPKLYISLHDRYSGLAIPSMLENILIQQYKISENASKTAASDFIQSMELAGLLKNGILYKSLSDDSTVIDRDDLETAKNEIPRNSTTQAGSGDVTKFPPLPSGIVVSFPADLAGHASLGEFTVAMKSLEDRAKELRK